MTQHRIFLSPSRPGVSADGFQRHWREVHAPIFAASPRLLGYVQNRPVPESWSSLRWQACSESFFADRDAEREAFGSDYYLDTVAADEAQFVDREGSWLASITEEEVLKDGPSADWRVLAFGSEAGPLDLGACDAASVLRLRREPPGGGPSQVVSAFLSDRVRAGHVAAAFGGLTLLVEPVAPVRPPVWPWAERTSTAGG